MLERADQSISTQSGGFHAAALWRPAGRPAGWKPWRARARLAGQSRRTTPPDSARSPRRRRRSSLPLPRRAARHSACAASASMACNQPGCLCACRHQARCPPRLSDTSVSCAPLDTAHVPCAPAVQHGAALSVPPCLVLDQRRRLGAPLRPRGRPGAPGPARARRRAQRRQSPRPPPRARAPRCLRARQAPPQPARASESVCSPRGCQRYLQCWQAAECASCRAAVGQYGLD